MGSVLREVRGQCVRRIAGLEEEAQLYNFRRSFWRFGCTSTSAVHSATVLPGTEVSGQEAEVQMTTRTCCTRGLEIFCKVEHYDYNLQYAC